jgi:hypothetical protein
MNAPPDQDETPDDDEIPYDEMVNDENRDPYDQDELEAAWDNDGGF